MGHVSGGYIPIDKMVSITDIGLIDPSLCASKKVVHNHLGRFVLPVFYLDFTVLVIEGVVGEVQLAADGQVASKRPHHLAATVHQDAKVAQTPRGRGDHPPPPPCS